MVVGRRIRFTAVLVAVVFALTGFSSSSGGSGGGKGKSSSKGSSSGGGCSSSKSKKKSSGGGSSASASASASPTGAPATVTVVTCTGPGTPVTTLRFTSRLDRRATVEIDLRREGAAGTAVETEVVRVDLQARETRTVEVPLDDPARAAEVRTCRLGEPTTRSSAPAATRSAGSGPTTGSGPTAGPGSDDDGPSRTPKPGPSKSRKTR
ncbi:hypothetical protein ACFYUL_05345 [Streptomyces sp. NPDC004311]|uniref:hypothetical protein n=1 Tax=Streptomyces sp. NPDC004311 TaxID=3364698 RepID=UPI0036C1CC0A